MTIGNHGTLSTLLLIVLAFALLRLAAKLLDRAEQRHWDRQRQPRTLWACPHCGTELPTAQTACCDAIGCAALRQEGAL